MQLFSKDIQIAATVYVVAASEEEALRKFDALKKDTLELREDECADIPIFGGQYHADMPEVSLSPAVTIHGAFPDDTGGMELVEEDLGESEDGDD